MRNGFFRGATAALALATLFAAAPAQAATITILNNDGVGEGFNDATPVAPVGGNAGVTLGQQRLIVFQHAANIWGSLLSSSQVIVVRAQFNPQTCTLTSAVLGSAGPVTIHRDFPGAPFAGTWYHAALANKLSDSDLSLANPDINATFNSNLGLAGCGFTWYYGLDGNEGTATELLPVVLHEIGHGLGFSTTTSGTTGNYNTGFPHISDRFLYSMANGLHWNEMTAGERAASAIACNKLAWDGPSVRSSSGLVLGPKPLLRVNAPLVIAGDYAIGAATFGPPITSVNITGNVVLYDDGVAATDVNDACEAAINGPALAGNIALINRGTCPFVDKVANAQAEGAIAVIIADNAAGCPPAGLGGTAPAITIPSIRVTQSDGNLLKANLVGQNVTIMSDPSQLAGGTHGNRVLMFSPNPFQGGSSVSHWDTSAEPNLLMEPAITNSLHDGVDLTLNHFSDIGWIDAATAVNVAPGYINAGDDGVRIEWYTAAATELAWTAERTVGDEGLWAPAGQLDVQGQNMLILTDTAVEPGTKYGYRISALGPDGDNVSEIVWVTTPSTGVAVLALEGALPNPAVRGLNVAFTLPGVSQARLDLVSVSGRLMGSMDLSGKGPGRHMVDFAAGKKVPSGTYFLKLTQNDRSVTKTVVVVN
jgi:hypothetical protein